MPQNHPKPPEGLSRSAADWWQATVADYELDEHHLRLLELACQAWDRSQQAKAIVDLEGLVIEDSKGGKRSHPAVAICRDATNQFQKLVRELALDVEAPHNTETTRLPRAVGKSHLRVAGG